MAMPDPLTAPIPKFAREIAHVADSTVWAMISRGELETISIGRRRLVVVESYRQLIAKKLAAPPEDARRNGYVPRLGSKKSKAPAELNVSVEDLGLSIRATNALRCGGIETLAELVTKSASELLRTPNLGKISLNEINAMLKRLGLRLGREIAEPGTTPDNRGCRGGA
jgi:hypothetical protein